MSKNISVHSVLKRQREFGKIRNLNCDTSWEWCVLGWVHTGNVTAYHTPYRDSVDVTRARITYQKLVTR
jgi:hypothetical protein